MAKTNRVTTPVIRRQKADPKIRLMETWECANGHDFGFDPDHAPNGYTPGRCPCVGCKGKVYRVKAAGVLR